MKNKIECRHCKREVKEESAVCPKCQKMFNLKKGGKKLGYARIVLISAFLGAVLIIPLGMVLGQIEDKVCTEKFCINNVIFFLLSPLQNYHDAGFGLVPLFIVHGAFLGGLLGILVAFGIYYRKKNEKQN